MLKIYSWNVNGIRAVLKKNALQPFLDAEQPDILCLQETKAKQEQVELHLPDYRQFWYSADRAGYGGTAIFSKVEPLQVVNGFPEDLIKKYKVEGEDTYGDANTEGRVMAAEFDKFWLVTVYTVNTKDDLSRLEVRSKHWDPAFLAYCKQLEQTKPVIFCGDLNVAHSEDDLANPKPNRGKRGFTDEERAGFDAMEQAGFVDTFRMFKQGNGYYTWWSHFANARERNVGWRIDYVLASASLKGAIKDGAIHPKYMGSDHCPVSIVLDV
ncbi:MAG TPA: exodeoxyribonuclease III [Candidatus Saccharimonadales bacterium]|nr:exodeoxyribonuclease III [Candidatus Saccharimonadales bacterium]